MPACSSPAAQDSDACQAELQHAAPTTALKKDKRSHKGRRQMEDSFMIHLYKVKMCTRSTPHNWKLCPWAHPGEAAARRHPSCHQADLCHAVRMCPLQNKGCPHGESCAWSRNIFEAHLHPDRYRTVMCAMGESCGRNICFFAHNEQELRTPPTKAAPSGMVPIELPLGADLGADAFQQLSMGAASSCSDSAASNIIMSSSNSAASNIITSSSSTMSSSSNSNANSSPRGAQLAAAYQPYSPGSAIAGRNSFGCAASPDAAATAAAAAVSALCEHGGMMTATGAMPALNLAGSNGIFASAEPCLALLSLQQQMASRAAAAAATGACPRTPARKAAAGACPRTPTRTAAHAAAMHAYADAVAGAANAATAAGLSSPLAAAAGSPPTLRSPLLTAGSPLATSPATKQHLMMMADQEMLHSPVDGRPLIQQQQQLLGFASPQQQLGMQQQQQEAVALQQLYHSQMQAAATMVAAAETSGVQPGLNRLAAGIMQQRQIEASNAAFAANLLAAQSASAMQAAVHQQQQQLANSMLLQELNLAGTVPCAADVAVQCMSPRERAALWEAETALAAPRQQQGMMLLAGLPDQAAGFWG